MASLWNRRFKYHENTPPLFSKRQEGDYMSLEEEVKRAVAHESVVKLEELDIPYYTERGVLKREELLRDSGREKF